MDRDLFILKNLTEKSELWVHGDRHHSIEGKDHEKDEKTWVRKNCKVFYASKRGKNRSGDDLRWYSDEYSNVFK